MNLNVNKNLPPNLVIPSAGGDLYGIGLLLFPSESLKRVWYHYPLIIFVMNFQLLILSSASAIIPINNEYLLLVVGDIGHFLGFKLHVNLLI
jgi:hypothetical protein